MKEREELPSAERIKAFTDAVAAIALTLLILPLMESVSDAAREQQTAGAWVGAHGDQLFSFGLSFVLIAGFWSSHHRLFSRIHRVDGGILNLSAAWMLTIVWLPVATAILGQMPTDVSQKLLYVGSLFATSMVMMVIGLYTLGHPHLHDMPETRLRGRILADAITSVLFVIAFVVAVVLPGIGYWAMALLLLTGPVHTLLRRYIQPRPMGAE